MKNDETTKTVSSYIRRDFAPYLIEKYGEEKALKIAAVFSLYFVGYQGLGKRAFLNRAAKVVELANIT